MFPAEIDRHLIGKYDDPPSRYSGSAFFEQSLSRCLVTNKDAVSAKVLPPVM